LKTFVAYILPLLLFGSGFAQDVLSCMMKIETSLSEKIQTDFTKKVDKDLQKIRIKKSKIKNDKVFIKYVFNFLHRKYLKEYQKTANLAQTIVSGKYNCVVGTALIGYFLEKMHYKCEYHETQTHTFLIVLLENNRRLLLESTAFFSGGLIDDEKQITETLLSYQTIAKIKLINLVGLQLYNQGVLAYEKEDYLNALILGNRAYYFYPSVRHKILCNWAKQKLEVQRDYSKL